MKEPPLFTFISIPPFLQAQTDLEIMKKSSFSGSVDVCFKSNFTRHNEACSDENDNTSFLSN